MPASPVRDNITSTTSQMSSNSKNGTITPDLLSSLVYFSLAIILMWMAMKSTEKMSNELSSSATKIGTSLGKWIGRQPWRGTKSFFRWTGATGGVQTAWKNRKSSLLFGSDSRLAREAREDSLARTLAGGGSVGRENARAAAKEKREAAELESLKRLGNVTTAQAMLRDSGSSAEKKKAAALYLSEKEALTGAEDFQKALSAVGDDLSAAKNIISKAPKTVLQNADDLSKSLQILNANGNQKLLGDVIAKAEKQGLGDTGDDYDKILDQLSKRDDKGNVMRDASGKAMVDENLKKIYDKRLAEQGQAHIQVKSAVAKLQAAGPVSPQEMQKAYAQVFDKINAGDLTKQNEEMLKSQEFIDYFKTKTQKSQKGVLTSMGRENKEAILREWANKGVDGI